MGAPIDEYFAGKLKLGKKTISWVSSFKKSASYSCERCGICCNTVNLCASDVRRLDLGGLSKYVESSSNKANYPFPSLATDDKGYCKLLRADNLCSAYSLRPMMCRAYPYILQPGFDYNLIADISLRCPHVRLRGGADKHIRKKEISESMSLSINGVPEVIQKSLDYRARLADYMRVTYAPSFIEDERRLEFMGSAIDLLRKTRGTRDLVGIMMAWSEQIGFSAHSKIAIEDGGVLKGRSQDKRILKGIGPLEEDKNYGNSRDRWAKMLDDVGNSIFFLFGKDSRVGAIDLAVSSKGIRMGNMAYPWQAFEDLRYGKGALDELIEYMGVVMRRPNFRLTCAKIAKYIIDYKGVPVVDYEIEPIVFSNAMMIHLDPIARILATINGSDEIGSEEVRLAASNIDSEFQSALSDGSLTKGIIKKTDVVE